MSFAVGLECGHGQIVIDARDTPPAEPWVNYPLDDDNSIDLGDVMTCVTCQTDQAVTGIYDTIAIRKDGSVKIL